MQEALVAPLVIGIDAGGTKTEAVLTDGTAVKGVNISLSRD